MARHRTIELSDCLVIVVRTEEARPLVLEAFDEEADVERLLQWVASQPELLALVVRAYRLAGVGDDALDELSAAIGGKPGSDEDWLEVWTSLEPAERRRLLGQGGEEA